MDEDIRRLQEKIAYLERHVVEQDKAMLEINESVARLLRDLRTFRENLNTGGPAGPTGPEPEQPPPHY